MGQVGWVIANGYHHRKSQVESQQRLKNSYLMPPCLTLRIIRYGSRVKRSNPGKGVAHTHLHLGVVANEKGAFGDTHNYGCQLYFTFIINRLEFGSPCDVMAEVWDCSLKVSELEIQLCYYVYFQTDTLGKGMNPLSFQQWVK